MTKTRVLIINALQIYQLSSDLNENIFRNQKKNNIGCSTWIKQLIDECDEFNISLKISDTLQLIPIRENEGNLMKILVHNIKNQIILEQMNICWI